MIFLNAYFFFCVQQQFIHHLFQAEVGGWDMCSVSDTLI